MGFADDLDAILDATPADRQTALFSATMPARILAIAERHLRDPARIAIARDKAAAGKLPRVRQVAYIVARAHKPAALERVLETEKPDSALVFCRTRLEVDTLVEMLNAHGHRAEALHGGMEQRQRDRVMGRFRDGAADLLVATDVAARGLDIERLSHVINYDVPASADTYVHRIGRTGRAGRDGTAITLAEPREHRLLRAWKRPPSRRSRSRRCRRSPICAPAARDHARVAARTPARRRPRSHARRRRVARQRVRHRGHRGGRGPAGARRRGGDGDDREIPAPTPPPPVASDEGAAAGAAAGAWPRAGRASRAWSGRRHEAVRRRRPPRRDPAGRSRRRDHRRGWAFSRDRSARSRSTTASRWSKCRKRSRTR